MKIKLFIFFIGVCHIFYTHAQENLSLLDAITKGMKQNYDLKIATEQVTIAANNNNAGEAGRFPTLTLNVNQNNALSDNVKVAFPTATSGQNLSNAITPAVNVDWILFNGFRVNINKQRLATLQSETEGNASIVIANTLQAIILGYYLAILEKERLTEFEKQLTLSKDKHNYILLRANLGSATKSEVLLEESNYLTDSINYVNQQLAYRNILRNLNVLLAENNVSKQYVFTDTLSISNEKYTYEDLSSYMFNNNVDLKKQYITQQLLGLNTKLQQSSAYPNLSLNLQLSNRNNSLDLSSARFFTGDGFATGPDERLTSVTNNYSLNFTISYTLFNGGQIKRAIRNAIVNEKIEQLRTDKLKNSLDRSLSEALDRYNIRRQLYEINKQRERAAFTNLELSKEKFKNGSINSFDYRNVQNNYLSSSILKLQAIYNLINSKIELMRLTGTLIKDFENDGIE